MSGIDDCARRGCACFEACGIRRFLKLGHHDKMKSELGMERDGTNCPYFEEAKE